MEMFLKIDKEADLPKFYKDTLMAMVENDKAIPTSKEKVVIFPTCFVNYNNPNLGLVAKNISKAQNRSSIFLRCMLWNASIRGRRYSVSEGESRKH